jgi:eukaryotic-like serine/threonine-protein kinase
MKTTEPPPPVPDPLIGALLDKRYRIQGVLGRGGMGVVYEGVHDKLGRAVAIKVLHAGVASDPVAVKRFLREARTASQLTHGNIVDVSDLGTLPDGRPYLVMAKMEGEDFAAVLNKYGPRTPRRTAQLLAGAASALDLIHAKGYVHRDVKPENLMHVVRADGSETTLLLDFGIVGLVSSHAARLTAEGSVFGTPAYMPPEVIQGSPPHPRGDVYALATVAFELLCGRAPYEADNPLRILPMKIMNDAPSMSAQSGLHFSAATEAAIAKGLTRDPDARWATAGEFVAALAAAADADGDEQEFIPVPFSIAAPAVPAGPSTTQMLSLDPGEMTTLPPLAAPSPPNGSPTLSIEFQAIHGRDRRSWLGWGIAAGVVIGIGVIAGNVLMDDGDAAQRSAASLAGAPSTLRPEAMPPTPPAPGAAEPLVDPDPPELAAPAAEPPAEPTPAASAEREPTPAVRAAKAPAPASTRTQDPPAARSASRPSKAPSEPSATAAGAKSAQALVQAATRELTQGHLDSAAGLYAQASRADPHSEPAFRGLGLTSERLGRKTEAIRAFRRALALAPNGNNAGMLRARLQKLEASR